MIFTHFFYHRFWCRFLNALWYQLQNRKTQKFDHFCTLHSRAPPPPLFRCWLNFSIQNTLRKWIDAKTIVFRGAELLRCIGLQQTNNFLLQNKENRILCIPKWKKFKYGPTFDSLSLESCNVKIKSFLIREEHINRKIGSNSVTGVKTDY